MAAKSSKSAWSELWLKEDYWAIWLGFLLLAVGCILFLSSPPEGMEKPMLLKPLATTEFLVAQKEIEGGSGANFIVEWISDTTVNKPVIEAVMIGIEGQTSISFVRTGIAIEKQ